MSELEGIDVQSETLKGEFVRHAGEEETTSGDGWIRQGLHDLCQPLMALECLLYVNREPLPGESLDAGLLRTVMLEGLVECGRMVTLVRQMQDRMQQGSEVQRASD